MLLVVVGARCFDFIVTLLLSTCFESHKKFWVLDLRSSLESVKTAWILEVLLDAFCAIKWPRMFQDHPECYRNLSLK